MYPNDLAKEFREMTPERARGISARGLSYLTPEEKNPSPEQIEAARQAMMLPNPREELLGGPLES